MLPWAPRSQCCYPDPDTLELQSLRRWIMPLNELGEWTASARSVPLRGLIFEGVSRVAELLTPASADVCRGETKGAIPDFQGDSTLRRAANRLFGWDTVGSLGSAP